MRLSVPKASAPDPSAPAPAPAPAAVPVTEPLEPRRLLAAAGGGSIKGMIFVDADGDTRKDPRERPIEGITVYLDTNQTGALDPGEPTTATNRKGQFAFKKLARTAYNLRDTRPAEFDFTAPVGGAWFVDLRFKKGAARRDFAYWPVSQGPKPEPGRPPLNPDPPISFVLYNTGATAQNNPDGTNPGPFLFGTAGEPADPYWLVERLNAGGDPLPFEPTYYSFNPDRLIRNGDLNPVSTGIDSTWIAPTRSGTEPLPATRYVYATAFDLTGLEPQTAELTGIADADDRLEDIRLNGISLGLGGVSGRQTPFSITQGFVAGVNTLEFIVANDGDASGALNTANPTGLRVDGLRGTARKIAAGPITLFNTGTFAPNKPDGSNNAVLGTGGPDGHWLVSMPDDGYAYYTDDTAHHFISNNVLTSGKFGTPFAARNYPVWDATDYNTATATVDSAFINPAGNGNANLPFGTYIYRTWFDLTGLDANTARIDGTMVADDAVVDVYINGNPTGQTVSGFAHGQNPQRPFTITQGMVSGLNVLDFIVENRGVAFSGLRVDNLRGTASGTAGRPSAGYPLRLPLPPFPPVQLPVVPSEPPATAPAGNG